MIICPLCGYKNPAGTAACKKCSGELQLYEKLYYMPDVLYNKAVNLYKQGELTAAIEILSAANQMRPKDKGILAAIVKSYIRLKNYNAALEKCYEILELGQDEEYAALAGELGAKLNRESRAREEIRDTLRKPLNEILSKTNASINERLGKIMGGITGAEWNEDRFEIDIVAGDRQNVSDQSISPEINQEKDDKISVPGDQGSPSGPLPPLPKRNNSLLIAAAAVSLIMIIGFGLLYWKLADSIKYQTGLWAKSTEGQIVTMTKNLALQADKLEDKQNQLQSQMQLTRDSIRELNSKVNKLAEKTAKGESGIKREVQQIKESVEKIKKEVEKLKTK